MIERLLPYGKQDNELYQWAVSLMQHVLARDQYRFTLRYAGHQTDSPRGFWLDPAPVVWEDLRFPVTVYLGRQPLNGALMDEYVAHFVPGSYLSVRQDDAVATWQVARVETRRAFVKCDCRLLINYDHRVAEFDARDWYFTSLHSLPAGLQA